MYVLSATYNGGMSIAVEYTWFRPGTGYTKKTEFVYSEPLGGWNILQFKQQDCVSYIDFLQTMVRNNIEVQRLIARRILTLFEDAEPYQKRQAVDALHILDPTFYPPVININCRWQCELLDMLIKDPSIHVISTCRNMVRLQRYIQALQNHLSAFT